MARNPMMKSSVGREFFALRVFRIMTRIRRGWRNGVTIDGAAM